MKLPKEKFIEALATKKIYYFSSNQLNTEVPHHYICIQKTTNELLILTCCTSQFDTVKTFVETRSLPYETLVWIPVSDGDTKFTKETYVNCNQTFTYTVEEFVGMYESNLVDFTGTVSEGVYEQILIGLHSSPLIDDETKSILPKP